jgi:hypothetical protein
VWNTVIRNHVRKVLTSVPNLMLFNYVHFVKYFRLPLYATKATFGSRTKQVTSIVINTPALPSGRLSVESWLADRFPELGISWLFSDPLE